MKRFILSYIISVFTFSYLAAQPRNLENAEDIAQKYVSGRISSTNKSARPILSSFNYDRDKMKIERSIEAIRQEQAPFYIFSDTSSMAFVIVSGDKRMKEVLAFGNNFPTETGANMPEGFLWLMESYCQQYELLQNGTIVPEFEFAKIVFPDVQPLIKTKWRQGVPFNNLCPKDCPSGCVATAMSQVMNYHQFPASGNGSFSYISPSRSFRCSYNFENATFQWDKLKNTYPVSTLGGSSDTNEISQVTYACGVSVGMDYDTGGSGAYMSDIPYALIHFFGYNQNVSYRDRTCFNATEWYDMLCKELEEGRPVLYGGVDSKNGGHAFIIEGCNSQTQKFYVNWGWGGDFDGEYELDALDPTVYRFSSYQNMIVNVSPNIVGKYEDTFYADRFSTSQKIELNKDISFTLQDVYCYTSVSSYVVPNAKFNGEIGVAIFDKDFEYISSVDKKHIEGLNNFSGYKKISFSSKLTKSMFPKDGTYHIAPYVKSTSSQYPTRIRTTGGRTDYIAVTLSEEDLDGDTGEDRPGEIITAWSEDFEYSAVPKGWSQQTILGESLWGHRYVLHPSEDMPIAAKGKGYIYLEYATSMQDRFNTRTVTRLETSPIPLSEEGEFDLSLQYRKYATLPESTDLLIIYYKKNTDWYVLTEVPITSQGDWDSLTIPLPVNGNLKLAFEGSPSKGAVIFLDNMVISERNDDSTDHPSISSEDTYEIKGIYNLQGQRMRAPSKGINIIRQGNQNRKILIR